MNGKELRRWRDKLEPMYEPMFRQIEEQVNAVLPDGVTAKLVIEDGHSRLRPVEPPPPDQFPMPAHRRNGQHFQEVAGDNPV